MSNSIATQRRCILVGSGVITAIQIGVLILGFEFTSYCINTDWCNYFFEQAGALSYVAYLAWVPLVFILSLVVMNLPEKVFKTWFWFSLCWILGSTALSVFIPNDMGSGFVSVPVKFYTIMALDALYFLVSIVVILVKSQKARKRKG